MSFPDVFIPLFYLALFNFLIYRFRVFQFTSYKPFVTHLLFNTKIIAGVFIWLVYTFYYREVQNNDVHKFYSDALVLQQVRTENSRAFFQLMTSNSENEYSKRMLNWNRNFDEALFNENQTIIRLNALLMFFSFKTYFSHVVFMCFVSLLGFLLLFNSVLSGVSPQNAILALPVLFFPSVLFWTSGVMKEPVLMLGIGLLIASLTAHHRSLVTFIKFISGSLIVLFIKFFVLACLLPAAIAFLLFRKREETIFVLGKYAVVVVVFLFSLAALQFVKPNFNPLQMLVNKQTHSVKESEYFNAGSRVSIPEIKPDVFSILKVTPVAVSNTISRPYLWETKNAMFVFCAVENILVITFILLCISFTNWRSSKNLNLFLFLLFTSLIYFALVGMCTPVLGNLVRYKAPLLPVFLLAFAISVSPKAIAESLSFVLRK